MPRTADLSHLLKLLDDESPVVRDAVRKELAAMRRELPERLLALPVPLDGQQERLLAEILTPVCREDLEETWLAWRWLSTPEARLEEALSQISAFLSGWHAHCEEMSRQLDVLAEIALNDGCGDDARKLSEFLFGGRGTEARLRGNSAEYYAANNSNLFWVLEKGLGNPISLCCIFILIGRRLGIHIEGCNFPGHFLARVVQDGQVWLVDCFNRGRFMLSEDVARHHPAANPSMDEIIHESASVETIIARVLRNLDEACERENNMPRRQVVRRL
ncbi:MAG: transglutaminase-like domain-containing protein, partial [Verrucomicrobiaceae bacterium]